MISGRSVPEAACGRYTVVAQREGTLTERDDGALEIQAESPYLVRSYDGMELSRVVEQRKGAKDGWMRMGNFVGESSLGGRRLVVTSTRASAAQVDRMLSDLTDAMSALPTSFASPVGVAYDRSALTGHDVLSQAYAFVRDAMRAAGPHDLPAAVSRILARPYERLVRERIEKRYPHHSIVGEEEGETRKGSPFRWILDPQHIKPGDKMPATNLSGPDLQALLDYLESLR